MRSASIQAGLFGAGVMVLLGLIALLPYVGLCIALPLYPLAFFMTGLATVRVAELRPALGQAAAAGATAGFIAAVIGGLAAMFLAPVRLSLSGGAEEVVQLVPPGLVESWLEGGLDPVAVTDFVAGVGAGMACCAAQLTIGAFLAAGAAAVYAAYIRE